MPSTPSVDAATAIDQAPFGGAQKRIVFLCALIAMLDGFDTQVVAFVAPVLAAQWGLPVSSFGPVFGAGLAGLMLGALVFGPAADRFGRRRVIMATTAIFGAFTLLTPWADSLTTLMILRLLTGLGLGGAMPNIIALTAEYAPARSRATLISLMFCGFPLGAVLGGFLAARMIPSLGWESTFWLGGALPLLLLPALFVWLPESIRLLAARRTPDATLRALLVPILGAERAAQVHFKRSEAQPQKGIERPAALRRPAHGADPAAVGGVLHEPAGAVLPGQLVACPAAAGRRAAGQGHRVHGAAQSRRHRGRLDVRAADRSAGPVPGAPRRVRCGRPGDVRHRPHDAGGVPRADGDGLRRRLLRDRAQISINALASSLYATEIRSTGVGWALGVGRAGSIVGPVVGGMLVGTGVALESLFAVAALPAWMAAVAIALLARRTMRRSRSGARCGHAPGGRSA